VDTSKQEREWAWSSFVFFCYTGVITQGKNRMRQFRTSGSVRGAAREGGSYRDKQFKIVQTVLKPFEHRDGLGIFDV
jgi:hypothetical protein